MKSTEKDIERAEGLAMGKKFSGASHDNEKSYGGPKTASKFHPAVKIVKSHDGDVARGEGLALGTKKGGGGHETVRQPKHTQSAASEAQAAYERAEMGNPDSREGE